MTFVNYFTLCQWFCLEIRVGVYTRRCTVRWSSVGQLHVSTILAPPGDWLGWLFVAWVNDATLLACQEVPVSLYAWAPALREAECTHVPNVKSPIWSQGVNNVTCCTRAPPANSSPLYIQNVHLSNFTFESASSLNKRELSVCKTIVQLHSMNFIYYV